MRWMALAMLLPVVGGCSEHECPGNEPIYEIMLHVPPEGVPPGLKMVITHPEHGTYTYAEADLVLFNGGGGGPVPVCEYDSDSPTPPEIRCRVAGFPPGNSFVASAPGYQTVVLFPQWAISENECSMDVWGNEATLAAE